MNGKITDRELAKLAAEAIKQGFTVERTRKNHIKFVAPKGGVCFASGTPSDYRSVRHARAKLRRLGLDDRRNQ